MPPKYNHPARVAERIATLDLVSNGRVEFGMGESASITELAPFGVPFEEKRQIWEDAVRCQDPSLRATGKWIVRRLAPECSRSPSQSPCATV